MNIGVVGSRTFDDYDLLKRTLDRVRLMFHDHDLTIVSGGAKGADSLAEAYSTRELKKPAIVFPVTQDDWNTYGKSAGHRRNQFIIDASDFVVAFWDGLSRGTNGSMNKTTKAGKPIIVVPFKPKPKNECVQNKS